MRRGDGAAGEAAVCVAVAVGAGAVMADLPSVGVVAAAIGVLPIAGVAGITAGVVETRCALAETWRT